MGVVPAIGSLPSITRTVTQAAHGFTVGQMVFYNGTAYALSRADASSTAEVDGIVSSVPSTGSFVLTLRGYVTGLSGLTAGTNYFLSDVTAGLLTATAPTTTGAIRKPVFRSDSTTSGYFNNYLGIVVAAAGGGGSGGANSPTFQVSQGVSDVGFGQRAFYIYHRTTVAQTVTKMECYVTNVQSGSVIQLGIYDAAGNRLAQGTVTATSATGIYTVTLNTSVSLTAATTYYYAAVNQTSEFNTKLLAANSFNNTALTSYSDGQASLPATMAVQGSRSSSPQGLYLMAY